MSFCFRKLCGEDTEDGWGTPWQSVGGLKCVIALVWPSDRVLGIQQEGEWNGAGDWETV